MIRIFALVNKFTLFAIILFSTFSAFASSYYIPGVGVRSQARGGATMLSSDDGLAVWHNPANLADQDGTRFTLDFTLTDMLVKWEPNVPGLASDTVKNEAPLFPDPSFVASSDFGLGRRFALALAFYGPYGGGYEYDPEGPQRYAIVKDKILQVIYQLSAGFAPFDFLRLGAGFSINQMSNRMVQVISSSDILSRQFDPELEVETDMSTRDFVPNWDVGFALSFPFSESPNAFFAEFGGVLRAGFNFTGEGDLTIKYRDENMNVKFLKEDGTTSDSTPIELHTAIPWFFGGGIRVGQKKIWDLEFNVVRELWSVMDYVNVDTLGATLVDADTLNDPNIKEPTKFNITSAVNDKRLYKDTMSYRLGGEYNIMPDFLTWRLGVGYEEGAIPDSTFTVALIDRDKIMMGTGFTVHFGWIDLDGYFTYMYEGSFEVTQDVGDYRVKSLAFSPEEEATAQAVNVGKYTTNAILFGVGTVVYLDRLLKPEPQTPPGSPPDEEKIRKHAQDDMKEMQ